MASYAAHAKAALDLAEKLKDRTAQLDRSSASTSGLGNPWVVVVFRLRIACAHTQGQACECQEFWFDLALLHGRLQSWMMSRWFAFTP